MKNVRELETYGAILIGCGIMAYTLMLASVGRMGTRSMTRKMAWLEHKADRYTTVYGYMG